MTTLADFMYGCSMSSYRASMSTYSRSMSSNECSMSTNWLSMFTFDGSMSIRSDVDTNPPQKDNVYSKKSQPINGL